MWRIRTLAITSTAIVTMINPGTVSQAEVGSLTIAKGPSGIGTGVSECR
jgi:hypothetical protein